ncbi:MAG: hypothetical protein PHY11_04710 [Bacilli bacterium]|nr:hypothetical protein [Bacilli bacterium]MDD4066263.1 hypothetical protein [Bacilli bacterium]
MSPLLAGILVIGGLIILFIVAYILNHRTPKPKGCENLKPDCGACHIENCAIRKKDEEK